MSPLTRTFIGAFLLIAGLATVSQAVSAATTEHYFRPSLGDPIIGDFDRPAEFTPIGRDSVPRGPSGFAVEARPVFDFWCGSSDAGLVPCDDTFKKFCAKIAKGDYQDVEGGGGACITPGGWNPPDAP